MKRILVIVLAFFCLVLEAALPPGTESSRALSPYTIESGLYQMETSNYGSQSNLIYSNGIKMLYQSSCWISGKRARRDFAGRLLYWLSYPPTYDNNQLTYQGSELWTPELVAVKDTLTSAGYDGDIDLYELLPAYNPRVQNNPSMQEQYQLHGPFDRVLHSILGSPAPLPFDPFNSENFLFSVPQAGSFETPGFQTYSAYFYDYCPFGTPGDRDWGLSSGYNTHYPLGLAVHQETYTWNLQNHGFLINRHRVYNTNDYDTIEDLALSLYVDADIGPESWGAAISADDVSGYVKGDGYEFAYTRDADQDGGLTPYYLATKLLVPGFQGWRGAWYWMLGNGPDDSDALSFNYQPRRTANEKYWLATGRNPNDSRFMPLIHPDPSPDYEQPTANDTRFMNTLFGARPDMPDYYFADNQGNYVHRLSLAPHAYFDYYSVFFVGESVNELKETSLFLEDFLAAGLEINSADSLTCIPLLQDPQPALPDGFDLHWYSYNNPDHFELAYKAHTELAENWIITNLPGSLRDYSLTGLDPDAWYDIKIGSVYYNPNEVYLESYIKLVNLSHPTTIIEPLCTIARLNNYPNPFARETRIVFELKEPAELCLALYNMRGQRVRELSPETFSRGPHQVLWDGRDDSGRQCANGIYYLRMQAGNTSKGLKLLLLR